MLRGSELDDIQPGDLIKNPFDGEIALYDRPAMNSVETSSVPSGSIGLVLAVTSSYVFVLVYDRIGWCPFGLFDRVLP